MGMTLKSIPFWAPDWKVKEVISASKEEFFNIKNLKEVANKRCNLQKSNTGHYFLTFENGDFIEFV